MQRATVVTDRKRKPVSTAWLMDTPPFNKNTFATRYKNIAKERSVPCKSPRLPDTSPVTKPGKIVERPETMVITHETKKLFDPKEVCHEIPSTACNATPATRATIEMFAAFNIVFDLYIRCQFGACSRLAGHLSPLTLATLTQHMLAINSCHDRRLHLFFR